MSIWLIKTIKKCIEKLCSVNYHVFDVVFVAVEHIYWPLRCQTEQYFYSSFRIFLDTKITCIIGLGKTDNECNAINRKYPHVMNYHMTTTAFILSVYLEKMGKFLGGNKVLD